jgi:hypothetical protein
VIVPASTRQQIADHLAQAEFALKAASNFECLRGTAAHDSLCAALTRVAESRTWVGANLALRPESPAALPIQTTWRERHRAIQRRLARLSP